MGDNDDLELARPTALAPIPRPGLASSFADAKSGELVLVDNQGDVVSRKRLLVRAYLRVAFRLSGFGVAWAALLATGHPVAAATLAAGYSVYGLATRGWNLELRSALALLAAQRYDEAFAAFAELEQRRLPPGQRLLVMKELAALEWIRGHRESALARYDRVVDVSRASSARWRGTYWHAMMERAVLVGTLGRLDEARRVLRELDGAPAGELFVYLKQNLLLSTAFHADDPAALPDDLVLHEWARAALGRNRFGIALVLLSWAFARRGDVDMAQHLLAEAGSRLDYAVANVDPTLGQWMADRMAEWAIVVEP